MLRSISIYKVKKLSLVLLCLLNFICKAQQTIIKNYNTNHGLPSSEVYSVMEDHKGYLWFTTDAGVTRFDGYHFIKFTTDDGLTDNTVFSAFEDTHHRIWFRTFNGKICFYENGKIKAIQANDTLFGIIKNQMLSSLIVDAGDTLWLGLTGNTRYIKIAPPYRCRDFQLVNPGACKRFIKNIDDKNTLVGQPYNTANGNAITINHIEKNSNKIFSVYGKGYHNPNMRSIKVSENEIYFSLEHGLFRIKNKKLEKCHDFSSTILSLYIDKDNNLWIGCRKKGIYCFPQRIIDFANCKNYLNSMSITDITEDQEGGIWSTSLEEGVFYLPNPTSIYYNGEDGLLEKKAASIIRVKNAYIISSMSGLAILRSNKIKSTHINSEYFNSALIENSESINDELVLFSGSGTGIYNLKTQKSSLILYQNKPFQSKTAVYDKHRTIWIGSYQAIYKYDLINKCTSLIPAPSRIYSLALVNNVLWVGCINGLWKYHNSKFTYLGKKNSLLSTRVTGISNIGHGKIAISTKGNGIIILKNDTIEKNITVKDGLNSNLSKGIFNYNNQALWICSNAGISEINLLENYKITNYTAENGLKTNEINSITFQNDTLFAATGDGIISFLKSKYASHRTNVPLFISEIKINNLAYPLKKHYDLSHSQNYLNIRFTGLNYRSNGKITYRYKLQGLEPWNYTENTSINYAALPPGNYNLILEAKNLYGNWNSVPTHIEFNINPPFWVRWWFILLSVTLLISITAIVVWLYSRQVNRRERERLLYKQKMSNYEMQALRAQMNPHFIFNAINSIQHYILTNEKTLAHDFLSKFAKLIRNVLEFSRASSISLKNELETLNLYIQLEQLRANNKFSYTIKLDMDLDPNSFQVPSLILQPFVENAILHGLFPKNGNDGKLTIEIKKQDRKLICVIEDNGIGRERAKAIKEKKMKFHQSMGESITTDKLKTLWRTNDLQKKYNITDLFNHSGEASGTRVYIELPVQNKIERPQVTI